MRLLRFLSSYLSCALIQEHLNMRYGFCQHFLNPFKVKKQILFFYCTQDLGKAQDSYACSYPDPNLGNREIRVFSFSMQIYLKPSRSNVMNKQVFKNNLVTIEIIDLEKKFSYLHLDVPRSIPCNEEHAQKNWRISSHATTHYASHVIHMHVDCAHRV